MTERKSFLHLIGVLILVGTALIFLRTHSANVIGQTNSYSQSLGILVTEPTQYSLESNTTVSLLSFSLAGKVKGGGPVNVYLESEKGSRFLVFTNAIPDLGSRNPTTRLVTGSTLPRSVTGEVTVGTGGFEVTELEDPPNIEFPQSNSMYESGFFSETCENSCNIPADLFSGGKYKLLVHVGKNTSLLLARISFLTTTE